MTTFDQQFIDMMVPHHMSAVEMAKIAADRREHPEIKSLAVDIIAAQEPEIAQMREWRKDWFGGAQTPPMDAMPLLPGMEMEAHSMDGMEMGGTMDMTADVEMLGSAQPFDMAFLEAMIPHHQSATTAAKLARSARRTPRSRNSPPRSSAPKKPRSRRCERGSMRGISSRIRGQV